MPEGIEIQLKKGVLDLCVLAGAQLARLAGGGVGQHEEEDEKGAEEGRGPGDDAGAARGERGAHGSSWAGRWGRTPRMETEGRSSGGRRRVVGAWRPAGGSAGVGAGAGAGCTTPLSSSARRRA